MSRKKTTLKHPTIDGVVVHVTNPSRWESQGWRPTAPAAATTASANENSTTKKPTSPTRKKAS